MNTPHIRWMIRRDMPDVLRIEADSFPVYTWTEEDFIRCLRQRNAIGMVAEDSDDAICGYMVYELHPSRLHILNLAVAHESRRCGIGYAMVSKLKGKLSPERRNKILLEVREGNLSAQLFFRQMGFEATQVLRDFYDDSAEDAYLFQHRCEPGPIGLRSVNRCAARFE